MKRNPKNWIPRKDKTVRQNSTSMKHIYGVYENDQLVFQGVLRDVAEYIGIKECSLYDKTSKWNSFEVGKSPKNRKTVVYLGKEFKERIVCRKCGKELPIKEFGLNNGHRKTVCKKCTSLMATEMRYKKLGGN